MASPPPHSHSTLVVPLLLLLLLPSLALAINVTTLLAAHPDLSSFAHLVSSTPSLTSDLASRSSLTLLAVPNSFLSSPSSPASAPAADLADVLRYHVLLEYLSPPALRLLPPSGKLVTTLYQTTGRATADLGAVNLTRSPSGTIIVRSPGNPASNATLLNFISAVPYNISVFTVDQLLLPYGFDLSASETRPSVGVNITRVLIDSKDFNVAASMLEASGVVQEFEQDERGAGITVFVPTDEAFAGLPATERLQSLPAEEKATVLKFHVLHSYYPLGSLESIVNPVQPTLATEDSQAGRFTLNITRSNGSVSIGTGVVEAGITRTVFDQNPVAIFAVSRVLLPREIFGHNAAPEVVESAAVPPAEPGGVAPEAPLVGPAPPPEDMESAGGRRRRTSGAVRMICTGWLYVLLLLV